MKEIDELQRRLSQLEQRNAQLEARNSQLEEKVDGISVTGDGMSGTVGGGGMMYVDPNAQSVGGVTTGITADITVCVDNGDGTFTQQTASFVNGILVSLS